MNTKKPYLWLSSGILLLAFFLATRMLNADLLFVDEYWSIRASGGTFGPLGIAGIWERTAIEDPGGMGVLYHILIGGWAYITGISLFSLRAFSLLFGLLATVLAYRLGKDMFSDRIGFYALCIMASSAFFLDFFHEIRAYTLIVSLSIMTIYAYYQLMRNKPHFAWYFVLSLSFAALLYSHYVAAVIGVVISLYHLTQFQATRRWFFVVLALGVSSILYLPWLSVAFLVIERGAGDANRQSDAMNAWQIIEAVPHTFSNANIALFFFLFIYALRDWSKSLLLLILWLLVSIIFVVIVNLFIPFVVHLRYLMLILPAIALILSLGLNQLPRKIAISLLVVWMSTGIYQSVNSEFISNLFGQIYRAPNSGFQQGLNILNQRASDGDMVLLHTIPPGFENFNYFPLDFYFLESDSLQVDLRFDQFERVSNSLAGGDVDYLNDVEALLSDAGTIWTMRVPELEITQRSGVVNYVLGAQYALCETVLEREDLEMQLYARVPQSEPVSTFGDNLIDLYEMQQGLRDDDTLKVVLGWWAGDTMPGVYSIGLHLFDAEDTLVRQHDSGLPDKRPFTCTSADIDLSDLPAGDYTLRALIYEWQTGIRLHSLNSNDYVDLQVIHID